MTSTCADNAFEHQAVNSLFPLLSLFAFTFFDELAFDFLGKELLFVVFVAALLLAFPLDGVDLLFADEALPETLPIGLEVAACVCILETVWLLLSVFTAAVVPNVLLDFIRLDGFDGSSQNPLALVELLADVLFVAAASAHIFAFDHCSGDALFQRDANLSVSFF